VFLLPLLEPASAADLSVRPVAHAVVPISHWDGWYASVSAGGTWTKGDFTRTSNDVNTFTESDFDPTGALTFTSLETGPSNFAESAGTGDQKGGAVFTFTTGYNVVWGAWLLGSQTEVSYNLTKTFLQGSVSNTRSAVETDQFVGEAPSTQVFSNSSSFATTHELRHDWTISEMAKIGYLVNPQLLVYGLVGWS
jgi:hypothetical protein